MVLINYSADLSVRRVWYDGRAAWSCHGRNAIRFQCSSSKLLRFFLLLDFPGRPMTDIKSSVARHGEWLKELSEGDPYTVFLCGPGIDQAKSFDVHGVTLEPEKPSAVLRKKISDILIEDGFEVVLGEDSGLEDRRLDFGMNAQDNELYFIINECNAIVIVADSVGSFCELGLFTWHFVHDDGLIDKEKRPVFVILINKEFEGQKSYFNEGPISSVLAYAQVQYVDFSTYDVELIKKILRSGRSIATLNKRGRPRKP